MLPPLSLIDTHLHLDAAEFDTERAALWEAAQQAGVRAAVIPAVEPSQWPSQQKRLAHFPALAHAWGIHPCFVDHAHAWAEQQAGSALDDEAAAAVACAALEAWITEHGAVAIGEIGLDRFVTTPTWSRQVVWFEAQLALAKRLRLPVLCHARRAVEAVRIRVRRANLPGGIIHAFNGSRAQAEDLIAHGFCLGFGGAMTHPRANHLHKLAQTLPLEGIVLETDAPDIPPAWANSRPTRRTEPADLVRYAAFLAEQRGMDFDAIVSATTANALRVIPQLQRLFATNPLPCTLERAK
ncbi:TatD family hydrolase [Hydrogenophilus thiooxidans]|uniref:TatD family hydrolase n=1 Tax=Hydrogenophilus thiooxidans TaxID=2820326 RepID=UPI001C22DB6C|nr:TatD family hydrolase [Hydrogenophilus thiooxidans]